MCVAVGAVANGPWSNPGREGRSESAAFSLAIPELGRDGETYCTFVRCECYGCTMSDALSLHAGDVILCEGRLSWQKIGEA